MIKGELAQLAHGKLVRVLGEAAGTRAYTEALASARLTTVETSDDLRAVADALATQGGMAAAVASILRVAAVVRDARTK